MHTHERRHPTGEEFKLCKNVKKGKAKESKHFKSNLIFEKWNQAEKPTKTVLCS